MFERFTDRARALVARAQEEARILNHNFIGTEHLLLGLISDPESLASKALESLHVSRDAIRDEVIARMTPGAQAQTGPVPFTPHAKAVLEQSLREAKHLGHKHIGTEHILLGLIRLGQGVGFEVLAGLGMDLSDTREAVAGLLQTHTAARETAVVGIGSHAPAESEAFTKLRTALKRRKAGVQPACPGCSASLVDAAVYKIVQVSEENGNGMAEVLFLYCKNCGLTIDDVILPSE